MCGSLAASLCSGSLVKQPVPQLLPRCEHVWMHRVLPLHALTSRQRGHWYVARLCLLKHLTLPTGQCFTCLQRSIARPSPQGKLTAHTAGVVQLYRYPGLTSSKAKTLLRKAQDKASPKIDGLDAELCYNVSTTEALTQEEAEKLAW